jgi:hypothetical protein
LDFAAADAGGANANALGVAVDKRTHGLQINIPAALGHVVRVADAVSELGAAATHFTYFGHNRLLLGKFQSINSSEVLQAAEPIVAVSSRQMSDTQLLTIVLAVVPTMVTVLVGILINNSRLTDLRTHLDVRFANIDQRFTGVDGRFDHVDRRFDEMRDLWRSELHRVEEVIDARLKHLEERD